MDFNNDIHRKIGSSYHHKPKVQGVDYSLFIMETVEKSLEKMETTPAAPRQSFPLQSAAPDLCFGVSVFSAASSPKGVGDYFYSRF